jgi:hypothetical protein
MSSHREAPEVSKDPVADSTDLYAFVSPDRPDSVTLIANYVPLQAPDGGPNFYEFGDDVTYRINIDVDGDGHPDVVYAFTFESVLTDPTTFLYNTGPITVSGGKVNAASWNRRQYFTVRRWSYKHGWKTVAEHLACPPCNIGPLSTPDYAASSGAPDPFTAAFIHDLSEDRKVFAGQRAEGFYVDLGAVFDLGGLRPVAADHATFGLPMLTSMPGVNATAAVNVHSIALQVPISDLVSHVPSPSEWASPSSVIGIWTSAERQKVQVRETGGKHSGAGPWVQVSRLGNPLFNEVLVPLAKKDLWNSESPANDHLFADGVANPELAQLIPILFTPDGGSTLFPNLAALNAKIASGKATRADLVAILLTGLPKGIVSGFQNYTGTRQADMLRLNLAIAPTTSNPSNLGVVGGDLAGFPNGRRVFDDVATIELKAVAGATYPLVEPSYTVDSAISAVNEGLTSSATDTTAKGSVEYLSEFPYLGTPHDGYYTPSTTPTAVPPASAA